MRCERLLVTTLLAVINAAAVAKIDVEVNEPRPFGYVIGDIARQTIIVRAADHTLDADRLPKPGRVSAWLERTRAHAARMIDGWRVELEYQFINAPREIATISLPAVKFTLHGRDGIVEEDVLEWPVTLAPLTPASVLARAGLEEMRPDAAAPQSDAAWRVRRLALYAFAAGAALLFWMGNRSGWWRRGARSRHFVRALGALSRARDPGERRAALRALHRAFDATAARTLHGRGISEFIAAHPVFAPARGEIAAFFALSERIFFAGADAAVTDVDVAQARALAARLAALERARR